MKRIIKTLLVVMALCLVLVAFTGCDAAINKVKDTLFPPKPCTHQGGTATCAIQAVCELCGESYGDLLDHQWAEGTCTTRPSCSVCGTVNGDNIAGHTIVEDEGYAATCTEPGLTDGKHCSKCNTILVAQFVIDPIGHDIPEATCTTGSVCNNCGVTFGYALGHSWVAATCTEAKTCSVCKVTEGDPLGHDMKDVEAKDNTCTEDGYTAHKACSRCDHKEGFEVDVAAHSVKVEFVAPTAEANGKVRFYCSACEDYEVIEYAGAALMTGGVYTLNPGDFPANEEDGVYKDGEVKFVNGFGIHLSGKFKNQENTKKFEDGYQSTHRFHFGGDTKYTDSMIRNAISFTTAGNTTLKVWWGAGDADRELVIYNLATGEQVTVTSTEKAKNDLCISEFTLPAGSYLLANTPKTNYYYKVEATVEAPHTHTHTHPLLQLPHVQKLVTQHTHVDVATATLIAK